MEMTHGMNPADLAKIFTGIGLLIMLGVALLALAIHVLICLFLQSCLNKVPAEHRKQTPGMVWLLLIPCFRLVWNFFVYPKIAESFKSYFASVGKTDVGDCGRTMAMLYSILVACSIVIGLIGIIPVIGGFICCGYMIFLLVIWIMVLVKFGGLKNMIP